MTMVPVSKTTLTSVESPLRSVLNEGRALIRWDTAGDKRTRRDQEDRRASGR